MVAGAEIDGVSALSDFRGGGGGPWSPSFCGERKTQRM